MALATTADSQPERWLFSAPVDLAAFLGSALVALGLLALGAPFGLLHAETPDWAWIIAVLMIDVAHVHATAFRVYFDPAELKRRAWLYGLTPLLGFMIGAAVYTESERWFWRLLAYLAVFHFVRQQYGWVALYRARAGQHDRWGHLIDAAAIYLATVYPLVYWHANLPRDFWWFVEHDFAAIPVLCARWLQPLYWLSLAAYGAKSIWLAARGRPQPGKDLVVGTTALCWYLGIVVCNSDFAFTVTNVIIHGVPYLVLIWWYDVGRRASVAKPAGSYRRLVIILATVWLLAFVEELLWDRGVWHERGWLFGRAWEAGGIRGWLVPALAVPQITHYVLDGFIWRRRSNPGLAEVLRRAGQAAVPAECHRAAV